MSEPIESVTVGELEKALLDHLRGGLSGSTTGAWTMHVLAKLVPDVLEWLAERYHIVEKGQSDG